MYNVGFCKSIVFKQKQPIRDRKLNPVCLWVSFLLTTAFIYQDGNNLTFSIFFRLAESRFSSPWANFICGLINTGNAGGHAQPGFSPLPLPPPFQRLTIPPSYSMQTAQFLERGVAVGRERGVAVGSSQNKLFHWLT